MNPAEEARFRQWWTDIQPGILAVAGRLVGSYAADVVQDVGVLALRQWTRFTHYDDFARWCYIRAKWLALDELARVRRQGGVRSVDVGKLAVPIPEDPYSELQPLIEQLPERQRLVVIDKLAGYSTEEIATRLQVKESAVRSHWRYAQLNLAKQIRDDV